MVVVQQEFDAELPGRSGRLNNSTGGPKGADFDARLTMRDVILVRRASKLKLGKTRRGHFTTSLRADVGGFVPPGRSRLGVGGGQARQESKFRFVDTHLEAFGDPTIREAQAKELTDGPAEDLAPR